MTKTILRTIMKTKTKNKRKIKNKGRILYPPIRLSKKSHEGGEAARTKLVQLSPAGEKSRGRGALWSPPAGGEIPRAVGAITLEELGQGVN